VTRAREAAGLRSSLTLYDEMNEIPQSPTW
jgi:hypothetical protein